MVGEEGQKLGAGQTGEIVARSAMSLGDYWGAPERTAQSFFPGDWFRPYDIGYLDEDSFLYYFGRPQKIPPQGPPSCDARRRGRPIAS